jgi:hypothetical protein
VLTFDGPGASEDAVTLQVPDQLVHRRKGMRVALADRDAAGWSAKLSRSMVSVSGAYGAVVIGPSVGCSVQQRANCGDWQSTVHGRDPCEN